MHSTHHSKWSARREIERSSRAARTPPAVKAQLIHLGQTGQVKEISVATKKKGVGRHFSKENKKTAHKFLDRSSLKLAEAILGAGHRRVSLRGAAVKSQPAIPQAIHWSHNNNFWRRLGYGGERYVPWKESRQVQRKEREAAARRGKHADHVLDYLHTPADGGNPVDRELAKLGIEGTQHSFAILRRPLDHTLDYLHVAKGDEQQAKLGVARYYQADHFKDFLSVPEDRRKVRLKAVDTFQSIKNEARA